MKGKLSKLLVHAYVLKGDQRYGDGQYAHLHLEIVPKWTEHDKSYDDQKPICAFVWQADSGPRETQYWYGGHLEVERLTKFATARQLEKVMAVYEKAAKAENPWNDKFDDLNPTALRLALEAEGCEFGMRDDREERIVPRSQIKGAEFSRWEAQYQSGSTLEWCIAEYESEARRLITALLNERTSHYRNSFDSWLQQGRKVIQTSAARPKNADKTWDELIAVPFPATKVETAS